MSNDSVCGSKGPDQTAYAQADLGLNCPHMPENTFSNGIAQIIYYWKIVPTQQAYNYLAQFDWSKII